MKELIAFFVFCVGLPLVGLFFYSVVICSFFPKLPRTSPVSDRALGLAGVIVMIGGVLVSALVLADAWSGFQFRITG